MRLLPLSHRPVRLYSRMLIRSTMGAALLVGILAQCSLAPAALVVERVGDGLHKPSSDALPVFLEQYSTNGASLGSIVLPYASPRPTKAPYNLLEGGSSASDGQLTRSVNGLYIQVPGYNATNKEASITSSLSKDVLRTIGLFDTSGVDTSRAFDMLTGSNFRSVVSVDGSAFWAAGQAGLCYVHDKTVVPLCDENIRCINIFFGQLYGSKGGTTPGIYAFGTGLPTGGTLAGSLVLAVPGVSPSPFGFQMNTAGNICFVADERDGYGIIKFSYVSNNWVSNYTLGTGWVAGARGLTVDWTRPGVPILYATTAESSQNRLIRIVDKGAGSAATTLVQASSQTVFRGVDFLPMPAVWRPAASGNWSAGGNRQWSNWSVGVANGAHILLQDVNTNSALLNLNLTNNTSLTRISSLTFSGEGYGTGTGTAYILYGNALNVSGGVFNDSPVAQNVKIPLGFTASQVISNGATLTLDGRISGNSGITKDGPGRLVLNAANQFTGAFTTQNGVLSINGVLSNSSLTIAGGAVGGIGRITGPVTVYPEGTLQPGGDTAPGTLTIDGRLELNGHLVTRISKTGTTCVSSPVSGVTQLSLGGQLEVQLISGNPAPGDVFRVFSASSSSGGFSSVSLPTISQGLYWDASRLITTGILTVRVIPTPEIRSAQLEEGLVNFYIFGAPGASYTVWVSSDPAVTGSWTVLRRGVFDQTGYIQFFEVAESSPLFQRFYRVSIP